MFARMKTPSNTSFGTCHAMCLDRDCESKQVDLLPDSFAASNLMTNLFDAASTRQPHDQMACENRCDINAGELLVCLKI